jgi:hypothetical protein
MIKLLLTVLCGSLLLFYTPPGIAGSVFSEGTIDEDLKYEGFELSEDGFLRGYIVNASRKSRQGIRLDMWTTNAQETRIYWRKSIDIERLGPGEKHAIKEPYTIDMEVPSRTKFMFRIPNSANFRN